jgi:DNA-binding winged helix-turn-helix (wHTH) protein
VLTVRFGPFLLNEAERVLTRGGTEIHLTPKAFDLLVVLLAEAPDVVPKSELHARVWRGTFVSDTTLVGVVKELRRALDDADARTSCIRTVHRVGYAFGRPVEVTRGKGREVSHSVVVGGRHVALKTGENRIGRDPTSDVWLDSAGVSRAHARVEVGEHNVTIEDLGSKNGTKANGEPVTRVAVLHDGDRIEIGREVMIYRCSAVGFSTETIQVPARRRSKE